MLLWKRGNYASLEEGKLNYGLIPVYNSHIGKIYTLPENIEKVVKFLIW
jgi:hypothetical protein